MVDPAGTYVSGAFRSGDVAMRLLRPSWPLGVPCCYLETAKGRQVVPSRGGRSPLSRAVDDFDWASLSWPEVLDIHPLTPPGCLVEAVVVPATVAFPLLLR